MGTISKALKLLEFFKESSPKLGLTELAKLSGRDKAAVLRYMTALKDNGFVEQDLQTRAYYLGPAILRLARIREQTFPTETVAREHMRWLRDHVGESTHLSLAEGAALSTVSIHERFGSGTRVHIDPSERLPYHLTASGWAYMAFAPETHCREILSQPLDSITVHSVSDPNEIRRGLIAVRKNGFAQSDQGFEIEVFGIAAPIFGTSGDSIGAIAVATPKSRMTDGLKARICDAVCVTAVRITNAMGGKIPDSYDRLGVL